MPLDKPRPKTPKRVMEKKRRARINDSLTELKNLVLQALNRNNPRHSKLEKADILEMTVKYLRGVHGRHAAGKSAAAPTTAVSSQYRSGFRECMLEVSKFLDNSDASSNIRLQLLDHLSRTCGTRQAVSSAVGTGAVGLGSAGNYSSATADGSFTHSLPIFRLPTTLSQDLSHSVQQSANLASDSVQSVQAMQVNAPPTFPIMNIQLPTLSKVPTSTLSLPVTPQPIPISPSMPTPASMPPPPPPPLHPVSLSKVSNTPQNEKDATNRKSTERSPEMANSEATSQSNKSSTNAVAAEGSINPTGGSVVITRTQGGDVTVVLPHSALPGGKLPTHLIPVYQPETPTVVATAATSRPDETSPLGPRDASPSSTPAVSVPVCSTSPRAGTVAPVTWYTRPAYLTANVDQGHAMLAQQGTPVTITLPIQARIVQNIIPVQAASLSPFAPGSSLNHIPVRMANPNGEPLSEQDLMWRPW